MRATTPLVNIVWHNERIVPALHANVSAGDAPPALPLLASRLRITPAALKSIRAG